MVRLPRDSQADPGISSHVCIFIQLFKLLLRSRERLRISMQTDEALNKRHGEVGLNAHNKEIWGEHLPTEWHFRYPLANCWSTHAQRCVCVCVCVWVWVCECLSVWGPFVYEHGRVLCMRTPLRRCACVHACIQYVCAYVCAYTYMSCACTDACGGVRVRVRFRRISEALSWCRRTDHTLTSSVVLFCLTCPPTTSHNEWIYSVASFALLASLQDA